MSLTIHIGQCGIEVGDAMLQTLKNHANHCPDETSELFKNYESTNTPNCLLLDTEDKVVEKTIANGKQSGIQYKHFWSKFSGSGNNWAHGYNGHAESSKDQIQVVLSKNPKK